MIYLPILEFLLFNNTIKKIFSVSSRNRRKFVNISNNFGRFWVEKKKFVSLNQVCPIMWIRDVY